MMGMAHDAVKWAVIMHFTFSKPAAVNGVGLEGLVAAGLAFAALDGVGR